MVSEMLKQQDQIRIAFQPLKAFVRIRTNDHCIAIYS